MSAHMADAATPSAPEGIGVVERAVPCEPEWEVDTGSELFRAHREPAPCGPSAPTAEVPPSSPPADALPCASSGSAGRAPAPGAPVPISHAEAERAARGVLVAVLEAIDGRRSPATLSALLATGPLLQVTRLAKSRRRPANAAQVRTVHVTVPGSQSHTQKAHTSGIEVCATYARGRRLFAVAAHMEGRDGRVRCTALRMPT